MDFVPVLIAVCTTILSVLCVAGNLITIFAIAIDKRLKRSVTNYCVVSLATADIIVGAVIIPFRGFYEFNDRQWIFGNLLCDIWYAINISTCTASILNLCIICLDRYISIFDGLNYPKRLSKQNVLVYIFLIWFISLSISFPAMIKLWVMEPTNDSESSSRCMLFLSHKSYIMLVCAITFYIPLVFMTFLYLKIYLKASEQIRFMRRGSKLAKDRQRGSEIFLRIHSSAHIQRHDGKERKRKDDNRNICNHRKRISGQDKAAKTLGIVFGAFLICWLPFFIKFPIYMFSNDNGKIDPLLTLVNWLGWFNSCLNPIIYWFWSRDFRRAFKRIAQNVTSPFRRNHSETSLELHKYPSQISSFNALGQGKRVNQI